jgi:hypothetical protein
LDTAGAEVCDAFNDIIGPQRNVLDARSSVVVDILLDLALFLSVCRLVYRPKKESAFTINIHFDDFIGISHDDGSQGTVLCVDLTIIDALLD